jgi:hypothetical protein
MTKIGAAAGLLFALNIPSHAASFLNGNDLFALCTSDQQTYIDQTQCLGYAIAIADALEAGAVIGGFSACIPEHATRGQIRDIVVQWLVANPALRHFPAAGPVAAALEKAFPCQ